MAISGSDNFATFASSLDCAATEDILAAGDWSTEASANLLAGGTDGAPPGSGTRWLLLRRGEDLALLSLRGADQCVGSVQRLQRGPFRATGGQSVDATATMVPLFCLEGGDGRAQISFLYDIEGGWIARLGFVLVPTVGSHELDPSDMGSEPPTLAQPGKSLFELLAAATDPTDTGELAPGEDFVGHVTVAETDPLSGTLTLSGLVDEAGVSVDLEASFACHLTPYRGAKPAPISERQGIALHLTATINVPGDFGTTSTTEVDLAGVLDAVTSRRYEAKITATGSGTFTETDYTDPLFERRCTGVWTGSQDIDVAGEVSPTMLHLLFTPAGVPALTFSQPCNVDARSTEPTLPFAYGLSGTLDVAWPPGTPATDHQSIDLPVEGLGGDVWEVTFTPAL